MLFNSAEFIVGFLPICLLLFHVITVRGHSDTAIAFLVVASLFFYGWWDWRFTFLLLGSVVANFYIAHLLDRQRTKIWLIFGIAVNLLPLAYFKYAHFFAESVNTVLGAQFSIEGIVLPLAISFFTFQQIAYLADVHAGERAQRDFLRYSLFVTFFPQLIAGPIVHHREVIPQYQNNKWIRVTVENLSVGISIFVIGLSKKVLFADPLGQHADYVFAAAANGDPLDFISAWSGAIAFSLQIYFDFSGYSDMAVGIARMFNIRLPMNFDSPYKSHCIIDFWRRWHITLSRFLRDYLYFPLGGGRLGKRRRYGNLMIVMLLGGLWHGAAWTFVAWGALHGFFLMCNHAWRRYVPWALSAAQRSVTYRVSAQTLTLFSVVVAWVLFRAESWDAASQMLLAMSGQFGVFLPESYAHRIGLVAPLLENLGVTFAVEPNPDIYPNRGILMMLAALMLLVLFMPNMQTWMSKFEPVLEKLTGGEKQLPNWLFWRPTGLMGACMALVLFINMLFMLQSDAAEFIYFQF